MEYGIPDIGLGVLVEKGDIERITLYGDFSNKSLRKITAELGIPDEAYMIHTIGGEGFAESSLLLIFNEAHAVVEYYKVIQMTNNSSLVFCLNDLDCPSIELYREEKQIKFSELSNYSDLPYQLFSDAVGTEFSDYYKNNASIDGTLCIFSYQDVWH